MTLPITSMRITASSLGKQGAGDDLCNLFHISMFGESLRITEEPFRRKERASEGGGGGQSQREEGTTKKVHVTERGGKMPADTSGLLRYLGSEKGNPPALYATHSVVNEYLHGSYVQDTSHGYGLGIYFAYLFSLDQLFPAGDVFDPVGTFSNVWRHSGCHNQEEELVVLVTKARDPDKYPAEYRAVPTTQNYPVPNVKSAF